MLEYIDEPSHRRKELLLHDNRTTHCRRCRRNIIWIDEVKVSGIIEMTSHIDAPCLRPDIVNLMLLHGLQHGLAATDDRDGEVRHGCKSITVIETE